MKERPILFSAPMIRAILAGQKTQTRRVVKPTPDFVAGNGSIVARFTPDDQKLGRLGETIKCPYGQPSDRLWVRETWQHANSPHGPYEPGCSCFYRADYWDDPHGMDGEKSPEGKYRTWIPSIHMPRSVSRILLEVVSVRVERLNDISESDCWAEGIEEVMHLFDGESQAHMAKRLGLCLEDAKPLYAQLWESINGRGSWDANPWVWVVEFKQIQPARGEG